jgi:hypothetical protein
MQKKNTILCFVDRAFRYSQIKKKQLDAHCTCSIFRQILHVSGVSVAHHQEVHRTDTTVSTNCCIHTVYLLMIGYRYTRNRRCLMKHTEDKLCIKLVFL